jgi:hypothetical protein
MGIQICIGIVSLVGGSFIAAFDDPRWYRWARRKLRS